MKRIKDEFLDVIERTVSFSGKDILEIGCGNGSRSIQVAKRCARLTAIEPDSELIDFAKSNNSDETIKYMVGDAARLVFPDTQFDIAILTLSFHHVPKEDMSLAIDESVRVTKRGGHIIFLEPSTEGTFFDAEITFDACDGDEREEKSAAYLSLINYRGYKKVSEVMDETAFQFDSAEDFIANMNPKKNIADIENFLTKNNFILNAYRRINIFEVPKKPHIVNS